MARLRTLKPGFFLDDELAECQPLARLLFAGLWTVADREGRLKDRPRKIKAETLPYDDCDVDGLLDDLHERGFIVRYEVAGRRYICVPTWLEHQQPHYKEALSTIPPASGSSDSGYVARPVARQQRERIFARDGHRCSNCGVTSDLAIDHIKPRSAGGDSSDENLCVLCRSCNSAKGNRLASQASADVEPSSDRSQSTLDPILTNSSCLGSCLGSGNLETGTGKEPSPASDEANGLVLLEESVTSDHDPYGPDFLEWWEAYGKVGGRAVTKPCYVYWRNEGVSRDKLLLAAANYIRDCHAAQRSIAHGSTFLVKKKTQGESRWHEWTTGEDHGDGHVQQRSGRQVDTTFGVLRQLIEEEA